MLSFGAPSRFAISGTRSINGIEKTRVQIALNTKTARMLMESSVPMPNQGTSAMMKPTSENKSKMMPPA